MSLATDLATRDAWAESGLKAVAATVIAVRGTAPRPPGARMMISSSGEVVGSVSGGCVESEVATHAEQVFATGEAVVVTFGISDDAAFSVGLACGGSIDVLIEPW